MTVQPTPDLTVVAVEPTDRPRAAAAPTRHRARRRALMVAFGLALFGAVLPVTAAHAEDAPAAKSRFTALAPASKPSGLSDADKKKIADLLGGSGQSDPSGPSDFDPQSLAMAGDDYPYATQSPGDLTNPTENPEPLLPPDPPDVPDGGPDDLAPPTEQPDPPQPPNPDDNGPDDLANPTENPDPDPNPNPNPSVDDSIPTPQRVDAGLGGTAAGSHLVAGLALIAAALVLALLVVVIARRHHAETRSAR